jgi:hypothetical protein
MLKVGLLSVFYADCSYAESHIYCYVECHFAECRHSECRYAECHYAECHGASKLMQEHWTKTTCLHIYLSRFVNKSVLNDIKLFFLTDTPRSLVCLSRP